MENMLKSGEFALAFHTPVLRTCLRWPVWFALVTVSYLTCYLRLSLVAGGQMDGTLR